MDKVKGKMDLLILESKASSFDEIEFVTDLTNKGVSKEIVTRLQLLGSQIKYVANQSIKIGKIILMKLWDFIKENPNLAIGMAIGLGLAVLAGMLLSIIPFIGTWLAGVIAPIFVIIVAYKGHRLDKIAKGELVSESIVEDTITIVKQFWQLLVDIFSSVKDELRD